MKSFLQSFLQKLLLLMVLFLGGCSLNARTAFIHDYNPEEHEVPEVPEVPEELSPEDYELLQNSYWKSSDETVTMTINDGATQILTSYFDEQLYYTKTEIGSMYTDEYHYETSDGIYKATLSFIMLSYTNDSITLTIYVDGIPILTKKTLIRQ